MNESELRDYLKEKMATVNLATLPDFINVALSHGNGYGEICVAIGAIAAAAAKAADRSENGGITGFQAGAVFWEFTRHWRTFDEGPKRMVQYANMLYPQYADSFDKTISADTWKWLQEEAAKRLAKSDGATGRVHDHWQTIVDGTIPFGYTISADD